MKRFSILSAVVAIIATASSVLATNPSLDHEHSGDLFRKIHHGGHSWPESGVINNGTPTGETVSLGGETYYLAYPPGCKKTDIAILYLTDIFGNALVNNRLLADSIAKAGYFVAMPDLFRGDPVPADAMSGGSSGFNMTAWRQRHPQAEVEGIIESAIGTLKDHFNSTKIGAVGYCFGGRYVALFLNGTRGIDVGFTAHPSGTLASEWTAVARPISIAFGGIDTLNPPQNRSNIENIFTEGNKTFQTALYSNAEHGFAVRTNTTDKQKAFAQESAYFQAIRWFDYWIKDE